MGVRDIQCSPPPLISRAWVLNFVEFSIELCLISHRN